MELIVRMAVPEDTEAVEKLEIRCFTVPWSYESLYHDIAENPMALYLVAEEEGRILGYAGVWRILDEGHITNVAVDPDHRRRHIGTALLTALTDACAKQGVHRFTLEVRQSNLGAQKLYQGMGFEPAGLRKGYYEDNGEDAVIMWKEMEDEGE